MGITEALIGVIGAGGGLGAGILATWQVMRQQRSVDHKTEVDAEADLSKAAMALALDLVRDLRKQVGDLVVELREEREHCSQQLAAQDRKLSDYRHALRNQDAKIEALRFKAGIPPERFNEIIAQFEAEAGEAEPA